MPIIIELSILHYNLLSLPKFYLIFVLNRKLILFIDKAQ